MSRTIPQGNWQFNGFEKFQSDFFGDFEIECYVLGFSRTDKSVNECRDHAVVCDVPLEGSSVVFKWGRLGGYEATTYHPNVEMNYTRLLHFVDDRQHDNIIEVLTCALRQGMRQGRKLRLKGSICWLRFPDLQSDVEQEVNFLNWHDEQNTCPKCILESVEFADIEN